MPFNVRRLLQYRELLKEFVVRDLQGRYVGSTMGLFWSVINPIVMLMVYTFIFSGILKVKLGAEPGFTNFALYLFCGMLPWTAFQETVQRSTTCIVDNGNLIKKLVFPAKILPLYIACSSLITEMISVVIFLAAIGIILKFISPYFLLLPVILFFQILFALGLSYFLATVNVFFRDTSPLISVVMTLWMFMTPIFYPASMVPERFQNIYMLNPMAHLVNIYRDIFLQGQMFDAGNFIYFGASALGVYLIGYALFTRYHRKFVDLL